MAFVDGRRFGKVKLMDNPLAEVCPMMSCRLLPIQFTRLANAEASVATHRPCFPDS